MEAKQRLLADWWRYAQHDPTSTAMLAYHHNDVDDLNQAPHALMLRSCRLGGEAVEFGGREFRVGDRVLCRHNDTAFASATAPAAPSSTTTAPR